MFFGRNFYRRLTVEFSMTSKYRYAVSVSLKFGDIIFEYFFYKRVFGFLPFYFYYIFEKIFLFQSKTKYLLKYVNQNFTSNKLNEKKSEPFCKKANLWKFGGLTNFFWNFYGKLELVKVRNVHQEVTFFCRQKIIFRWNLISQWSTLYFKTKAELMKKMALLVFLEGQMNLSQPHNPLWYK